MHRPTAVHGAGGTVRLCCDGPLKGRESAWRAPVRREPFGRLDLVHARWASKRRAGRAVTDIRPGEIGFVSSERRETPGEGRRVAARRARGSHHGASLRRATTGLTFFVRQCLLGPVRARAWAGPLSFGPFRARRPDGDGRSRLADALPLCSRGHSDADASASREPRRSPGPLAVRRMGVRRRGMGIALRLGVRRFE